MLQRASSCCYFSFCSLSAPQASTLASPPHTLSHSTQTQAARSGSLQACEHSTQNSSVPGAESLQITLMWAQRPHSHSHVDAEALQLSELYFLPRNFCLSDTRTASSSLPTASCCGPGP